MGLKFEIDVPAGTTKIDLGPVLEPILRRIVDLERRTSAEFKELLEPPYESDWKNIPPSAVPTTTSSVEQWLKWVKTCAETTDRLSRLTYAMGQDYLEQNGWRHRGVPRGGSFWDIEHLVSWAIEVKKYAYDFTATHLVSVPVDSVERQLRIYHWGKVVCEIVAMYRTRDYNDGLKFLEVLDEIEKCGPPLVRLANQAE